MQALINYVEDKNKWNAIFGMAPMDINNDMDRVKIAQTLDSDLSPENLHCDGEISQAQAMKKYRVLSKVAEQLIKLDPTVTVEELY